MLFFIFYNLFKGYFEPYLTIKDFNGCSLSLFREQKLVVSKVELKCLLLKLLGFIDIENALVGKVIIEFPIFNLLEQPIRIMVENVELKAIGHLRSDEIEDVFPSVNSVQNESTQHSSSVLQMLNFFFASFVVLIMKLGMIVLQKVEVDIHDVQISLERPNDSHEVNLKIQHIELKPHGNEPHLLGEVDSIFLQKEVSVEGISITHSANPKNKSSRQSVSGLNLQSLFSAAMTSMDPSAREPRRSVLFRDELSVAAHQEPNTEELFSLESISLEFKLDLEEESLCKCYQVDTEITLSKMNFQMHKWSLNQISELCRFMSDSLDTYNREQIAIGYYNFIRTQPPFENESPPLPLYNDSQHLIYWFELCNSERHSHSSHRSKVVHKNSWRRLFKKLPPRLNLDDITRGSHLRAHNHARSLYMKLLKELLSLDLSALEVGKIERLRFLDAILPSDIRQQCRLHALEGIDPNLISFHNAQSICKQSPLVLNPVPADIVDEDPIAINLAITTDQIDLLLWENDKKLLEVVLGNVVANFCQLGESRISRLQTDSLDISAENTDEFDFRLEDATNSAFFIQLSFSHEEDSMQKAEIETIVAKMKINLNIDWVTDVLTFFESNTPSANEYQICKSFEHDLEQFKQIRQQRLWAPLQEIVEKKVFCLLIPAIEWQGIEIVLSSSYHFQQSEFRLKLEPERNFDLLKSEFSDVYTASGGSRKQMRYILSLPKCQLTLIPFKREPLQIIKPYSFRIDIHQDVLMPALRARTEVRLQFADPKLSININSEILHSLSLFSNHPLFRTTPSAEIEHNTEFLKSTSQFIQLDERYFKAKRLLMKIEIPDKHVVELKVQVNTPKKRRATVLDIRWEDKLHFQFEQSLAANEIMVRASERSSFKVKLIGFGVNEETIATLNGLQVQFFSKSRNPFGHNHPETFATIKVDLINIAFCKQCIDALYYIHGNLVSKPQRQLSVSFADEALPETNPSEKPSVSYDYHYGANVGKINVRIFQYGKKSDKHEKKRFQLAKLILGGANVELEPNSTNGGINTIDLYELEPTRVWDDQKLYRHWSRIFETESKSAGVLKITYCDNDFVPTLAIRVFNIRCILLHRFLDAFLEVYYGFYEHNEELFGPKIEEKEDFNFCEIKGTGDADGLYEKQSYDTWVQEFDGDKIVLSKEYELETQAWFLTMPMSNGDDVVIAYIESEEMNPWDVSGDWYVSSGSTHRPKKVSITPRTVAPQSERTMRFTLQFIDPRVFIPTRTNSNRFLMIRASEIGVHLPTIFIDEEEGENPPFVHVHLEDMQLMSGKRLNQSKVEITGDLIDGCNLDVNVDFPGELRDVEVKFSGRTTIHLTEEQYTYIWDAYVDWEANIYESWPHADLFWEPQDTGYPLWMKIHILFDQLDLILYYGEDSSEPMALIHAIDAQYHLSLSNVQESEISLAEVVLHDVRERVKEIATGSQVKWREKKYGPWFTGEVLSEAGEEQMGDYVVGHGVQPAYITKESIRRNKNKYGHRLILMALKEDRRKEEPGLFIKIRRNFIGAMVIDITARDAHVHLPEMSLIQDLKVMFTGRYKFIPSEEPERNLNLEPEPIPLIRFWQVKTKIRLENCKLWLPEREAQPCELPQTDQDDIDGLKSQFAYEYGLDQQVYFDEDIHNLPTVPSPSGSKRDYSESDGESMSDLSQILEIEDPAEFFEEQLSRGRQASHSRDYEPNLSPRLPQRKRGTTLLTISNDSKDINNVRVVTPRQSLVGSAQLLDGGNRRSTLRLPNSLDSNTAPSDLSISFVESYNHDKELRRRRFSASPDVDMLSAKEDEEEDNLHLEVLKLLEEEKPEALVRNDRFCVYLTGMISTTTNMCSDFTLELDLKSISAKQMFGYSYWHELLSVYIPRERVIESPVLYEYFDGIEQNVECLQSTRNEHIFQIPEACLKVLFETKPYGSDPLDTDQDLKLQISRGSSIENDTFDIMVSPDFGFLVGIGDMLGKHLSDTVPPFEDEIVYPFPIERIPNNTNRWGLDISIEFPQFSILLIDSVFGSLLNLMRLDFTDLEIKGSTAYEKEGSEKILMKGLVKFGMQMDYWNYRLEQYEPLIEKVGFSCILEAPTFDVFFIQAETLHMFNLNVSNIALENIARISKFLTKSREESDRFLRNKDKGALDPCRFKIQNKCGKQILYSYGHEPNENDWEICPEDKTCNIFTADRRRDDMGLWVRWWDDSALHKVDLMSAMPRYWSERHCEFLSHVDTSSRKRTLVIHSAMQVKNVCALTLKIQINDKDDFDEMHYRDPVVVAPHEAHYVPVVSIRDDTKKGQRRLHLQISKIHTEEDEWANSPVSFRTHTLSPHQSMRRQQKTLKPKSPDRPRILRKSKLQSNHSNAGVKVSTRHASLLHFLKNDDECMYTIGDSKGIRVSQQPKLGPKGILKKLVFYPPRASLRPLYPLHLNLHITQQSKVHPKVFTFTPKVILRNATPISIYFALIVGEQEDQKQFRKTKKRGIGLEEAEGGWILPAVERQLLTADDFSTLLLGLTSDQLENANPIPVFHSRKNPTENVELPCPARYLKITWTKEDFTTIIQISFSYWLYNLTDFEGLIYSEHVRGEKQLIHIRPHEDPGESDEEEKVTYCYGHMKDLSSACVGFNRDITMKYDSWSDPFDPLAISRGTSKDIEVEVRKRYEGNDVTSAYPLAVQVKNAGKEWGDTKIISIVPQFVLINTISEKTIYIRQMGTQLKFQLKRGCQLKHFYWLDSKQPRQIEFAFESDAVVWSAPFAFNVGEHSVWCLSSAKSDDNRKWLHVTVRKEDDIMLIMFEEGDNQYPPYRINNETLFTIEICQVSTMRWRSILPHNTLPYCWDDPTAKHTLLLRVEDESFGADPYKLPLDGVNHFSEIKGGDLIEANARTIYVNISTEGPTKVLYVGHIHPERITLQRQTQQNIQKRIKALKNRIDFLNNRIKRQEGGSTLKGSLIRRVPTQYYKYGVDNLPRADSFNPEQTARERMAKKIRKLGIVSDEPARFPNKEPILEVTILEAANLVSKDTNGFSDPFVIARYGKQEKKTAVRKKTLNPTWKDETFSFPLQSYAFDNQEELEIEVRDQDFHRSQFLGIVYIDIASILEQAHDRLPCIDEWYSLQARRKKKDGVVHGKIHVKILIIRNDTDMVMKSSLKFNQEIEAKQQEIHALEGHLKRISEEDFSANSDEFDPNIQSSKTETKIDSGELDLAISSAFLPDMRGCTVKYQLVHDSIDKKERSNPRPIQEDTVTFNNSAHHLTIESGKPTGHKFALKLLLCHTVKEPELIGECSYDLNDTLRFNRGEHFQISLPINTNAMNLRRAILEAEKEKEENIEKRNKDKEASIANDPDASAESLDEANDDLCGFFIARLKWKERSETQTLYKQKILLNISGVSLSLIDSNYYTEIAYASIRGISLDLSKTDVSRDLWFTVENIQIDNSEFESKFPVVFSINRKNHLTSHLPLIQLSINQNINKGSRKVTVYPYIAFLIQEMDVVLESRWLLNVRTWTMEIVDISRGIAGGQARDFSIDVPSLPEVEITTELDKVYIETLSFSPLKVGVSSHHAGKPMSKPGDSRLVNTILNLQPETQIRIDALVLQHVFCSNPTLVSSIRSHITNQLYQQIYKLIGVSVQVVGDPLFLFENLAVGVAHFFYEPVSGIIHRSPQQFGKGILRGTTSFLGHTVGGVMASTSGVTTVVQKVAMGLTMDSDFQHEFLNDIAEIEAGATIAQSALIAGKGVVKGITSGLMGLVIDPYNGARQNGVKGLTGGVVKGILGVALKPIAGVLHGTSALTGGIKNFALNIDKVVKRKERVRYPRVFEISGTFQKYDAVRARANFILKTIDKRYAGDFLKATKALNAEHELIVSSHRILFIKVKARLSHSDEYEKIHVIEFENLVDVRALGEEVLVMNTSNKRELKFSGLNPKFKVSASMLVNLIKTFQRDWRRLDPESPEFRGHSASYDTNGLESMSDDGSEHLAVKREFAERKLEDIGEEIEQIKQDMLALAEERKKLMAEEFFRVKLKIVDVNCDRSRFVFWVGAAIGRKFDDVQIGEEVILEGLTELTPIQVKCLDKELDVNAGMVRIDINDVTENTTERVFETKTKFASESYKLKISLLKEISLYKELEENELQNRLEEARQKRKECQVEISQIKGSIQNRSLMGTSRAMNQRVFNQSGSDDKATLESYRQHLEEIVGLVETWNGGTMTLELDVGKHIISDVESKGKGKYYVQILHNDQKLKTKSLKTMGPWGDEIRFECHKDDIVQFKVKRKGKMKKTLLASTSLALVDLCFAANVEEDGKLMWLKLNTSGIATLDTIPVLGLRIRIEGDYIENKLNFEQDKLHQFRRQLGWKDPLIEKDMKNVLFREFGDDSKTILTVSNELIPTLGLSSTSTISTISMTPQLRELEAEINRLKEKITHMQLEKTKARDVAEKEALKKSDEILTLRADLERERKEKEKLKEQLKKLKQQESRRKSLLGFRTSNRRSYSAHFRAAPDTTRSAPLNLPGLSVPQLSLSKTRFHYHDVESERKQEFVDEIKRMHEDDLPSITIAEDSDGSVDHPLLLMQTTSCDSFLKPKTPMTARKSRLLEIPLRKSFVFGNPSSPRSPRSPNKQGSRRKFEESWYDENF